MRAIMLTCAVAAIGGCRVAPPRYQTTWERATSGCYLPAAPFCHGYSPTVWNRWPEECQSQDYVVVEEIARPLQPSPAVEAPPTPVVPIPPETEIFEVPPTPDTPETPGLELPERLDEPQSTAPRKSPLRAKGSKSAKQRAKQAQRKSAPVNWTAHLQRYVGEVTQIR